MQKEESKEINKYNRDFLQRILIKKAAGYAEEEITEEFAAEDDGLTLKKRKVTLKRVPPDLSAVKLLLEGSGGVFEELSDEELIREKERLLHELKNQNGGKGNED